MKTIFYNKVFISILIMIFKVLYMVVIYHKCNYDTKAKRNLLTFLSIPFPIIICIICVTKYKRSNKDSIIIFITLILYIVSIFVVGNVFSTDERVMYYDKDGIAHNYAYDVTFTDEEGNRYSFGNKTWNQVIYKNTNEKALDAALCYINSEGYLHYDDDISITAKDETCCIDNNGELYYPAKYTSFNKDGTIKYVFNSANFKYDRFAKAYVHDYIPYYDSYGNKYMYSYDGITCVGSYINLDTGKSFDSEYTYVDKNGYLVYDVNHSFVELENINSVKIFKDFDGNLYYKATSVTWNKNGELLDSAGNVVKVN